jgi:hypothetical protein
MAKQTCNIGTAANDGTGDPLRTAFDKVNDNFTEVYDAAVEPQYFYFENRTIRVGVRDTAFVIDQTITEIGFDGSEDTDWENLQEIKSA